MSDVAKCFNITKVDIENMRQIVLYTDKAIKIQLGHDGINKKLENLSLLLLDNKEDLERISDIDLRFGGVIVKHSKN